VIAMARLCVKLLVELAGLADRQATSVQREVEALAPASRSQINYLKAACELFRSITLLARQLRKSRSCGIGSTSPGWRDFRWRSRFPLGRKRKRNRSEIRASFVIETAAGLRRLREVLTQIRAQSAANSPHLDSVRRASMLLGKLQRGLVRQAAAVVGCGHEEIIEFVVAGTADRETRQEFRRAAILANVQRKRQSRVSA
jgi:hypothetical protein